MRCTRRAGLRRLRPPAARTRPRAAAAGARRVVGALRLRGRGPGARGPGEVPQRAGGHAVVGRRHGRRRCRRSPRPTSSPGRPRAGSGAGAAGSIPPSSWRGRWRDGWAYASWGASTGCPARRRPAWPPRPVVVARASWRVEGRRRSVLLVDDIATTGATLASAAACVARRRRAAGGRPDRGPHATAVTKSRLVISRGSLAR